MTRNFEQGDRADPGEGIRRTPGIAGGTQLAEMEPDVRSVVVFDGDLVIDRFPAVGGSDSGFTEVATAFLEAAVDGERVDSPLDSCHVTTDSGEVFLVREAGLTMIAVTERFVLASLMAFDMRMALRSLALARSGGRTPDA